MIFADVDPATAALYAAIAGLLVAAGNYIQSVIKDKKDERVAKKKKSADDFAAAQKAEIDRRVLEETAAKLATTTKETAREVSDKLETVHKAVNGEGLGGKLDAVIEWQKAHDAQDNKRHDDMLALVLGLRSKIEGTKPPAVVAEGGKEK